MAAMLRFDLPAFLAGALLAAMLLIAGHYVLQPPRPVLRAPATYIYGVLSCLIGLALYALLMRQADVPLVVVAGVFVVAGLADILCYRYDGSTETAAVVESQRREIAALREALCGR